MRHTSVLRLVPPVLPICESLIKEYPLYLTTRNRNMHANQPAICSLLCQCISMLIESVTDINLDSVYMDPDFCTFNQVSNLGNCFVTRHQEVKLLQRLSWIWLAIDFTAALPKSVRNHLLDRMELDGENGQSINQAEPSLHNPDLLGEVISTTHRCVPVEIRSPWDSTRIVSQRLVIPNLY